MRYRIEYRAHFSFQDPISEQQAELRLIPRQDDHHKTLFHSMELNPNVPVFEHQDAFGNRVQSFSVISAHNRLEIRFQAEVENHLKNPFDYPMPDPAEERAGVQKLLREHPRNWNFVLPSGFTVPSVEGFARSESWPVYDPKKNLLYSIQSAMDWVGTEFRYDPGATDVHCPLEEVLEKRSGVCQDFAHLLIAIVRHWGFPARYVMGYQYLEPTQEEFSRHATHAWVEVYIPGAGWQGFDATHRLLADDTYIPVAVGRDSQDAAPERGSFKGATSGNKPEIELFVSQQ